MPTLNDVYRKFGEVSEAAQLLETELGNQLLLTRASSAGLLDTVDPVSARALVDKINRHTLGGLIREASDSYASLDDAVVLLERALAERNRLAHSFYRQHNFRRNSEAGCAQMLQDLESIHDTLIDAYKLVMRVSGINLDALVPEDLPTQHRNLE